jgi:glycosyltransferase involved in cell wall biosynthesis
MKLVHVVEDFSPGNGVTSAVAQLAIAAVGHGHTVEIVTTSKSPDQRDSGIFRDLVRTVPRGAAWCYSPGFSDALVVSMKDADVLHVHGVWMYPQWCAALLARRLRWPLLLSTHNMLGGWLWRRGTMRRIKKRAYFELFVRSAFSGAVIHALSRTERAVLRAGYFPDSRIETIPNGFEWKMETSPCGRPSPGAGRYFLFLGRIHPVKGLPLLIEAFAAVARADDSIRLVIAGPFDSPAYEKAIREQIAREPSKARISVIGTVAGEAKATLISGAWALCAPSYSEGVSMVALEAMAAGVPVITSTEAGIDDLDSGGGITVHAGDLRSVLAALRQALAWSASERAARGGAAAAFAVANYSWSTVWPQYEALYLSVKRQPDKLRLNTNPA